MILQQFFDFFFLMFCKIILSKKSLTEIFCSDHSVLDVCNITFARFVFSYIYIQHVGGGGFFVNLMVNFYHYQEKALHRIFRS